MFLDKSKDFYEILGLQKNANNSDILKAFRSLALKLHPDKSKKGTKEDFQLLVKIKSILADPKKRRIYDKTGKTDFEKLEFDSFNDAYQYFRDEFKKVTEKDIDEYAKTYKKSKEEENDVLHYIELVQGNFIKLFDYVPLSCEEEDAERFVQIIEKNFKSGKLKNKKFKTIFDKTKNKAISKKPKKSRKRKANDDMKKLSEMIKRKRNKSSNNFLDYLEQKYKT